jgi:hypothetical protein
MNPSDKIQLELARISASLSNSVESSSPEEWQTIVGKLIRHIDYVIERIGQAPAKIGKKWGRGFHH